MGHPPTLGIADGQPPGVLEVRVAVQLPAPTSLTLIGVEVFVLQAPMTIKPSFPSGTLLPPYGSGSPLSCQSKCPFEVKACTKDGAPSLLFAKE